MSQASPSSFPIADYFNRIGFQGSIRTDEETLISLHRAHVFTLPFENLNPWTGMPVPIDQDSLVQKIILNRNPKRGGYCFELNQLFFLALRSLGFKVEHLNARVWRGESYGPRSHQITLVEINGKPWLADVGFGGNGLLEAIPFETGRICDQTLDRYRLLEDKRYGYRLESLVQGEWQTLYAFSLDPFTEEDFKALNYFVSTSASSYFTRVPICTRPTENARHILYGKVYKVRGPEGTQREAVETSSELKAVLKNHFDLEWPQDLPLPDPTAAPANSRSME